MSKTCANCGKNKPDEAFNKYNASSDGLQSYCRQCQKEVRQQNLGAINYRCVICNRNLNNHNWICSSCYKKWVEQGSPVSEWPEWIQELVRIERRNRYVKRKESGSGLIYINKLHKDI